MSCTIRFECSSSDLRGEFFVSSWDGSSDLGLLFLLGQHAWLTARASSSIQLAHHECGVATTYRLRVRHQGYRDRFGLCKWDWANDPQMHVTILADWSPWALHEWYSQQLASETTTTLKQLSRWYLAALEHVRPLIAPQTGAIASVAR